MADVERIVGYRVDREISRSSIASVYQGFQESLQREVLIKRLHPQFVRDTEIRARFEREAHALARIKHRNIVHIYDYRADDENMVLVQEWIGGGSVAEYMRENGPLTEPEAIALVVDVLEGLDVAHKSKVIHRDVKPSNLMLSKRGSIKITDFGLAQFEGAASLTQQGAIMGTPAYMAPEMVNGQPGNPQCDLYSVGVTLYEVLTGENPFQADHISQTLQRVLSVRPGKLEGVRDETNRLLALLMAKDPNQRPATAGDALEVVLPLAREFEVERGWEAVARTSSPTSEGEGGDGLPLRTTTTTHSIRPAKKASPPKAFVYGAAAVMVLAVVAVWFFVAGPGAGTGLDPDSLLTAGTSQDTVGQQPPGEPEIVNDPGDDDANTTTPGETGETTNRDGDQGTPGDDEPVPAESNPAPGSGDGSTGTGEGSDVGDETPAGNPEPPVTTPDSGNRDVGDQPGNADPADGLIEDPAEPVSTGPDSGFVMLSVQPWAHVYLDSADLGMTPLSDPLYLPRGPVEFELVHPKFPAVGHEVNVPGGLDTLYVSVNLYNEVSVIEFIDAVPWAEVALDGQYIGRTPIGKAIFVPPGDHTLTFTHPDLPTVEETITATAGGEPYRIRVNLYE